MLPVSIRPPTGVAESDIGLPVSRSRPQSEVLPPELATAGACVGAVVGADAKGSVESGCVVGTPAIASVGLVVGFRTISGSAGTAGLVSINSASLGLLLGTLRT